jgi:hypothetical protein
MSNSTTMPEPDKQEWASVESKAKDALASVREMAGHATSAVGAMASRAACDVSKEADQLTANAGVCMEHLGEKIGKNAPGNASQSIAGSVREGGEYLQSAKLGGMAEDVAHLIRRNPIPAVLIAIGLGWFVSRTIRS